MTHYGLHCLNPRSLSLSLSLSLFVTSVLDRALYFEDFTNASILNRVTLNGDQYHLLTDSEMWSFRFNFQSNTPDFLLGIFFTMTIELRSEGKKFRHYKYYKLINLASFDKHNFDKYYNINTIR